MYRKKEFEKRYLIIIIIVVLAILLVILSVALNKNRELTPVEKIVKDSGTFVIDIVSSPINFIKDKIRDSHEKNNIFEKYEKLKAKENQMDKVMAETDDLKDEISKLKATLKLNTVLSDKIYTNATIINRNIDYWYDELTVDKGKKDGIEKNMAVVNHKGLVGKISKVSNHFSTVKLLANENISDKISVKIKVNDGYIYGLISKYDSKTNTYTVEGISENKDISTGADVVTTGMGDVFPSGLLVGHVKDFTTDNFDLSKVVVVESSVDFDDIDYISILKRKGK